MSAPALNRVAADWEAEPTGEQHIQLIGHSTFLIDAEGKLRG